ncbi:hypothetical protein EMIHUDRAFT_259513, partial [Emiliania huxleyi CCMP1516]
MVAAHRQQPRPSAGAKRRRLSPPAASSSAAPAESTAAPAECVELFLGGVSQSPLIVQDYLVSSTSLGRQAVSVAPMGSGSKQLRVQLRGRGAYAAASELEGKQPPTAPFREVKMHRDWYCPCGAQPETLIRERASCGA